MLDDIFRHILGRTEGHDLGFGQRVRTYTGKCLKCRFPQNRNNFSHDITFLGGHVADNRESEC